MLLYRRRVRKLKRDRIYGIHPYISKRKKLGNFYTVYMDLLEHEDKLFIYFRMSIKSFDELQECLKIHYVRIHS